jgi:hypothetical protein
VANAAAARTRAARAALPSFPFRRAVALALLALVGFLYYRPTVAYLDAREALARDGVEVSALRAEKRRLERLLRDSRTREALVRDARRLAYVKPGEQLFIVKGVEQWRRARARARATLDADGRR